MRKKSAICSCPTCGKEFPTQHRRDMHVHDAHKKQQPRDRLLALFAAKAGGDDDPSWDAHKD